MRTSELEASDADATEALMSVDLDRHLLDLFPALYFPPETSRVSMKPISDIESLHFATFFCSAGCLRLTLKFKSQLDIFCVFRSPFNIFGADDFRANLLDPEELELAEDSSELLVASLWEEASSVKEAMGRGGWGTFLLRGGGGGNCCLDILEDDTRCELDFLSPDDKCFLGILFSYSEGEDTNFALSLNSGDNSFWTKTDVPLNDLHQKCLFHNTKYDWKHREEVFQRIIQIFQPKVCALLAPSIDWSL